MSASRFVTVSSLNRTGNAEGRWSGRELTGQRNDLDPGNFKRFVLIKDVPCQGGDVAASRLRMYKGARQFSRGRGWIAKEREKGETDDFACVGQVRKGLSSRASTRVSHLAQPTTSSKQLAKLHRRSTDLGHLFERCLGQVDRNGPLDRAAEGPA